MKKILFGGLAGGIVMFIWSAISHMVLPFGEMGVRTLTNEAAVLGAMRDNIHEPGLYLFPGFDKHHKQTPEEEKAWTAKYLAGPTGMLLYHPTGSQPMTPRPFILELLSNVVAAIVLAYLISRRSGSLTGFAGIGALFGMFAWLSISFSYWNWYGFPGAYVFGEAVDQVIGWMLSSVTIGLLARRGGLRRATTPPQPKL